jgi:hypothetical protein
MGEASDDEAEEEEEANGAEAVVGRGGRRSAKVSLRCNVAWAGNAAQGLEGEKY